jgi:hypothetical protein
MRSGGIRMVGLGSLGEGGRGGLLRILRCLLFGGWVVRLFVMRFGMSRTLINIERGMLGTGRMGRFYGGFVEVRRTVLSYMRFG